MRILFITQWFDPEPGAIRGRPLARWLRQRGHEVRVVTGFPNYPGGKVYPGYRLKWREWEVMDGVPVLRVPLYPSHNHSAAGRIANYGSFALSAAALGAVLAGSADVAYVYHPPATVGFPGLVLKWLRQVPYVYHIADMWPESVVESGMVGRGWRKGAVCSTLRAWCNFVYHRASAISVLSPGFKHLLVERGVDADKVGIIYNWADDDVFRPQPPDPELKLRLGLAGKFNVVYAGNLGAFQGLDTLLQAADRLGDTREIQIVVAGTGQKEQELKQLAAKLRLQNVVFLGARPYREMPAINSLADVLLVHLRDLAIARYTIPSKTQVALASGRPALMAVRGDAAEIIERFGAGLVCEPENPAALAATIRRFYEMSAMEREAMGRRGREAYLKEMSLEVGAGLTESMLAQSCGRQLERSAAVARAG